MLGKGPQGAPGVCSARPAREPPVCSTGTEQASWLLPSRASIDSPGQCPGGSTSLPSSLPAASSFPPPDCPGPLPSCLRNTFTSKIRLSWASDPAPRKFRTFSLALAPHWPPSASCGGGVRVKRLQAQSGHLCPFHPLLALHLEIHQPICVPPAALRMEGNENLVSCWNFGLNYIKV